MKKAALLRGALVTPSSATLGTSGGIEVGSTYSLLDRVPGWNVLMASTGVILKEDCTGRGHIVHFGEFS